MRATLFAVVISLFVLPLVSQAENQPLGAAVQPNLSQEPTQEPIQDSKLIHLNQADVDTLTQSFKGIGRKRAEAIIAYREANGGFKSIADLALVKGIGKAFVDRNLQQLQETYTVD